MTKSFELSSEENVKFAAWSTKHLAECPIKSTGTIGERFTYSFTPTSLGTVVVVKCACGASEVLTDFTKW